MLSQRKGCAQHAFVPPSLESSAEEPPSVSIDPYGFVQSQRCRALRMLHHRVERTRS